MPFAAYADFLASWQHLAPTAPARRSGRAAPGPGAAARAPRRRPAVGARRAAAPPVALRPGRTRIAVPERGARLGRFGGRRPTAGPGALLLPRGGERVPRSLRRIRSVGVDQTLVPADVAAWRVGGVSPAAAAVYRLLDGEGALFTADLRAGSGLDEQVLESGAGRARHGRVWSPTTASSPCAGSSSGARGRPPGMQPSRASISSVEQQLARRLSERHRHRQAGPASDAGGHARGRSAGAAAAWTPTGGRSGPVAGLWSTGRGSWGRRSPPTNGPCVRPASCCCAGGS